jgi:hypothetical protein
LRRLVAAAILLCAVPARAVDVQLSSETIGQGWQLRAGDDTIVNRRRLTQMVGFDVTGLGPKDVYGNALDKNQFYLSLQLRFDAEFGDYADLAMPSGRTPQREIYKDHFDLLWGFIGARSLFGFVDAKLGRQLMVDLFDWRSFDGIWVEARAPFHAAVEVWGGLNVTGAAPFDSAIYRADGVALGGNPRGSLDARQEDALQPTFGVAVRTWGLRDFMLRLSYARTTSSTNDPQPGEPTSGVVDETVALTARGRLLHGKLIPWLGFRWDLLGGRLADLQAGLRWQISQSHGLTAEYVQAAPTFDGDSIWNVFGSTAFSDVRLVYDLLLGRWRFFARGFARLFPDEPLTSGHQAAGVSSGTAWGASAGTRADFRRANVRLDGYYEDGWGGLKAGGDLSGRILAFGDWLYGLVFDGRISYVYFHDDLRPIDSAHSFGMQLGARYTFVRGVTLHLLVEENVNHFYASQFRALAMLDLSFFLGARGPGIQRPRAVPFPSGLW